MSFQVYHLLLFMVRKLLFPKANSYQTMITTATIPLSLNSLSANYKLRYDVNETSARNLANFFESKSG